MDIKKIVFGIILLISVVVYGQQDIQFTQYMYNMNVVNPAYAGSEGTLNIGILGRTQWVGLSGAPKTLTLTANAPIAPKMGLGISIIADEIGPIKEQNIYADYSYTIKTSDLGKLAFGIKAGVTLQSIDFLSLTSQQAGDPLIDRNNLNESYPNFGAGLFYYTDKFYTGVSVPNIIESRHFDKSNGYVSDAAELIHFYITSGYVFDISESIKIKPSIMLKGVKGAPLSIDLSGNVLLNEKIELGMAWRIDDSVAGMINLLISKGMRLGYAYDHTLTNLGEFNSGSHEVFLLYNVDLSRKGLKSPRFF